MSRPPLSPRFSVHPQNDWTLVEPMDSPTDPFATFSGVLPESVARLAEAGTVVAVGPGTLEPPTDGSTKQLRVRPLDWKPGDHLLFRPTVEHRAVAVEAQTGRPLWLIRRDDVICKLGREASSATTKREAETPA